MLIVLLSVVGNFALYPVFSVGVSIILLKDMAASDQLIGLSRSILYVGPIAGSLLAGVLMKRMDYRKLVTRILLADSALLALMAATLLLAPLMGAQRQAIEFAAINLTALCIVASIVIASIAVTTAMQRIVPGHLMGRVNGVDASVSVIAIPAGQMLFSVVSDHIGSSISLLIFAVVAFSTSLFASVLYQPMLKNKEKPSGNDGFSA